MTTPKLTPEQLIAARRDWEGDPSASYASIAAKYRISKALVGQIAKREGWVKDPKPADSEPVVAAAPAVSESAKVTGNAASSETRTPSPAGETAQNSAPTASVAPAAARPMSAWHVPPAPDHFDAWQREDYLRDQVAVLVVAQNQAHQAEQRALSNQWRLLMRSTSPDAAAVRSHKLMADALRIRQGEEKSSLLDFIRSEQGKLPAQGNVSVRISVVQIEGAAFLADNSPAAIVWRAEARKVIEAARRELVAAGLRPMQVLDAISRIRGGAAPDGEIVDVDAAVVGVEGA
jgi:hypothetical protein